jgi:hypothetical protein
VKKLIGLATVVILALVMASGALADPRISATATANSDRSISVEWNVPAGSFGGAFIVNPTSTVDFTGELPFDSPGDDTIDYNLLQSGWTNYKTLPLYMTITQPTTVYVQVQLIDPFNDDTCTQGDFATDCDSQVIPLTIQPICTQVVTQQGYYKAVVVKPAHLTKKLVERGHWLRRNGRYVRKLGHRVWVKAKYKKVYHPAVTKQVWVPPVYSTECH